ncbi:MAG: 5'-3' exonuclease H3TH domain-containing protein, partial [Betaproteobacteria bacterium]
MLLVDGSSYLYRAFHAMPDLRSPAGFPTGAVHGMVAMMKRLREQYPAEHAACVFDAPGPTFRDEWYPDYKGHRAPMPEPLVQQIDPIHEVVRLLGWPVLQVGGIEADDVIGTLARQASASGHRVLISTGDKDLAQLVTPDVGLVNTMSNESLDEAGVLAKFGVPPERIIDYLTLMGDAVDNVPGVEKVGPKTAAKWIAEYGSLDGVIAAAASIKGAAGENLRKALDWLPMGRRLVTVKCDCDLAAAIQGWPALERLALREVDQAALHDFYQRYGFRTWLRELDAQGVRGRTPPAEAGAASRTAADAPAADPVVIPPLTEPVLYETVSTPEQFQAWLQRIRSAPLVAFDTETDSLDPMAARLVGLSFSVTPGQAAYIPLHHDYPGVPQQLDAAMVLEALRPWFEDATAAKLGQNIKYDLHVMANAGITVRGYVHDTLLQSYVLEAHRSHSLESLAERHLNRRGLSYEEVCGKGVHQIPFSQVDLDKATRYSGEDSDMTLHVHQVLWPQLERESGLRRVYQDIEMPCAVILQRMERHGVLVDSAVLQQQSRELGERIMGLEQQAYEMAGQPFNLGSPKQIG